ncbi:MAG TPA: hypothetical protein VES93_04355 [Ornithinibacter sp.]|nr:hypothetical protein [Ornithinibacter sp.]
MVQSVKDTYGGPFRASGGPGALLPDGSRVEVRGPAGRLREPWFVHARWSTVAPGAAASTRTLWMLELAPRGVVDELVHSVLEGDYVAEYTHGSGVVLLASNDTGSEGLVAWRGRWHEAYCWVNEAGVGHDVYLAPFAGIRLTDHRDGIRVEFVDPGSRWERLEALKTVPDVGLVSVRRTPDLVHALPRWAGARVRSGELWRQDLEPEAVPGGGAAFVLANEEAVLTIHPESRARHAEAVALAGELDAVRWSA